MKEFIIFIIGCIIAMIPGYIFRVLGAPVPAVSLVRFSLGGLWGYIWAHKYIIKDW